MGSRPKRVSPAVTVYTAVTVAFAALLAVNDILNIPSVISLAVACSSLWGLYRLSLARVIFARLMIASCIFAAFYIYTFLRIPRPGPDDLSHYAGREVIVV